MKNIKNSILIAGICLSLFCVSCGKDNSRDQDSGSDSQTTPNDSSGAESRAATGVGDDNQNEEKGYPSNQANLNSDSTRKLHDDDTTSAKAIKDKPNKHQ